ncbi:glycosyltransferase family 8 protein [Marinobacter fonticola]|uniref:glycosyltransferase family 8 protein n=1 Tax=Marinobacter fonticola TaxID=2603215 RepID=UPI0011E627B0|nr:glycosyltransferase family 8 protein [Marinobacter fonticola]
MPTNQGPGQRAEIDIGACCDENYVPFASVMMISALENAHPDYQLHFHFVADKVPEDVLAEMRALVEKRGGRLSVYPADNLRFDGLPTLRFGSSVYQRILLADYLPPDIHRVIYIDSDTLVIGDVSELWELDLDGKPVAAVEDLSRSACESVGVSRQEYFNSGVLVMDLEQWRAEDIHGTVARYAGENAHRFQYVDQCSLNAILHTRWKRLSPAWNQQANIYKILRRYSEGSAYTVDELREGVGRPKIVHFTGKKKPWLHYCFHPFKPLYRDFLRQTPWGSRYPVPVSRREKLRYVLALRQHYKWLSRSTKIYLYRNLTKQPTDNTLHGPKAR